MAPTETAAHQRAEQPERQDQQAPHHAEVDAVGSRQQARVALQVVTELMERAQAALYLIDIVDILLVARHQNWVVHMAHDRPSSLQLLTQEYVLVAALLETLVEGTAEQGRATDEDI